MTLPSKCLFLFLFVLTASAVDKDKAVFRPAPASSYETRQTVQDVTIAAIPYDTEQAARTAFGKLNPYKHGVLPVLLVIQNNSKAAIRLENMRVQYMDRGRTRVDSTPPNDVKYVAGGRRPNATSSPIPSGAPRLSRRKNPLEDISIETRAFSARMLPPGDSAHGFFYFQTGHRKGATIYLTGLADAGSGKELFYFEIPLDKEAQ
jgi:hypothetical protein